MNILNRFIRFITFIDLPIKQKFLLFSMGVLFWMLLMYAISVAVSLNIGLKSNAILDEIVPAEKTTQELEARLGNLGVVVDQFLSSPDAGSHAASLAIFKTEISHAKSLVSFLKYGSQKYPSRGGLATLIFPSGSIRSKLEQDAHAFQTAFANLEKKFDEISTLKATVSRVRPDNDDSLVRMKKEFKQILADSVALNHDLSAKTTRLYESTLNDVENVLRFSLYAFSVILVIATALLVVFSITITKSFAVPIMSIIDQIHLLGQGKVNLSSKITVQSRDEIGLLTENINNLMEELQRLVTFKKVIEEDDSPEDVYSRLGKVFEYLDLREFTIYEVSGDAYKMKPVYPLLINDHEINCSTEILTNCNLCKVKKTGHTISSADYPHICKQFRSDLDKVHVCTPMTIAGSTGGVVQFLFDRNPIAANGKAVTMFKAEQYIKESLSVLEAKRHMNALRDSALKDALTGLYNRRFLQEYTETLIAGVLRRKKSIGLVMGDLDYFKQVNDSYGHNVGDEILKQTATVLKNSIRASDLVVRFGGEEFLLIFLDVNQDDTLQVAEKIREAIHATKMKVPDGAITKTISLGVSEFPLDTEKFWQAIKFADVALYKAKEAGRNKVVRFTPDMWTEKTF